MNSARRIVGQGWAPAVFAALLAAWSSLGSVLSAADYVIHISVDGLRPDYLQSVINADNAPNFKRFQNEGAWTNNARADYAYTITLPNHTSMVTGRPVTQPAGAPNTLHHGWTSNGDPGTTPAGDPQTLHNSGNPNVPYKASTWDVARDAGFVTALFASKHKFILYDQSYNGTIGAPGPYGQDKILASFTEDNASPTMQDLYRLGMATQHFNYTFLHYADPDIAGHTYGWGGTKYNEAVTKVDGYLGELFTMIQDDELLVGKTAIVLSADHGGSGTDHSDATLPTSYTIPFYAWGAGVAHGDLYALNAGVRANPGTSRPDYNATVQPIRNGDGGNLALALLGLGAIPGSYINASQNLRVAVPGDFNADGAVDAADLAIWQTDVGAVDRTSNVDGDADGDHDVDGADFLVWQQQWGAMTPATAAVNQVPEPRGAVIAVAIALLLVGARRR